MRKFFSLSNVTAGFVAVMVGYTSSVAIIFQAAAAAGANAAEISSCLLALGLGMGICSIGMSWYYRIPIFAAWSTPGAALLVTSLSGVSLPETLGAFVFSAILITLSGVTGVFEKIMNVLPRSLSSAMLAGILLHFGTNIFVAMQHQFWLVASLIITYLIGKKWFPRFVILVVLLLGITFASIQGLFQVEHFQFAWSSPIFIKPEFAISSLISIGIPLFFVTMTSQNIPGVTIMKTSGYQAPISSMISWTGFVNLLLAPFGAFAINMAAITAAICMSKEADPDPAMRYKAAMFGGFFYLLAGIGGATIVALFSALPNALVMATAGLALLGTISNSLKIALEDEALPEPGLITFLVSASGITIWGIGAAFWALAAGVLSLALLKLLHPKSQKIAIAC